MHRFDPALGHDDIETLADDVTTQPPPFIFSQYLSPTLLDDATARTTSSLAGPVGYETGDGGFQGNIPEDPMQEEFTGGISTNLNVTRQEILTLTSFLGRIPQSIISDEGDGAHQTLSLTVVGDVTDPTLLATSNQEDQTGPSSSRTVSTELFTDRPMASGKRKRPKYSLTVSMLKKHPILKFSATGPLDADKTPYKWWCRVCRTELSLMSRGPLELISHYRTDSHLIKEHRIRMEVPGTPLFDKEGKEIQGVALPEAKKVAKDTHPIAPQLDSCHPLVGQTVVPALGAVSSPTDKVLFQINLLEYGLRHGGHISSLVGLYEGLARLTSSDQMPSQNWSDQRIFVSILFSVVFLPSILYSNAVCFNRGFSYTCSESC